MQVEIFSTRLVSTRHFETCIFVITRLVSIIRNSIRRVDFVTRGVSKNLRVLNFGIFRKRNCYKKKKYRIL